MYIIVCIIHMPPCLEIEDRMPHRVDLHKAGCILLGNIDQLGTGGGGGRQREKAGYILLGNIDQLGRGQRERDKTGCLLLGNIDQLGRGAERERQDRVPAVRGTKTNWWQTES